MMLSAAHLYTSTTTRPLFTKHQLALQPSRNDTKQIQSPACCTACCPPRSGKRSQHTIKPHFKLDAAALCGFPILVALLLLTPSVSLKPASHSNMPISS